MQKPSNKRIAKSAVALLLVVTAGYFLLPNMHDVTDNRIFAAPTSYDSAVRADAPQHYWKAQEKSGQTVKDCKTSDACTGGADATMSGAVVWADKSLIPTEPSAVSLAFPSNAGGGGQLASPANSYDQAQATTVEFMIELDAFPEGSRRAGIQTNTLSTAGGWYVTINNSGALQVQYGHSGGTTSPVLGSVELSKRTHVVVTLDATTATSYINGVKFTVTLVQPPTLAQNTFIKTSTAYLDGQLSHIAIYSKALSQTEAMKHFRASRGIDSITRTFYTSGTATNEEATGTLADPLPFHYLAKATGLVEPGSTILMKGHTAKPDASRYVEGDYQADLRTGKGEFKVTLQGTEADPITIKPVPGHHVRIMQKLADWRQDQAGGLQFEVASHDITLDGGGQACDWGVCTIEFVNVSPKRRAVTEGSDPGIVNVGRLVNNSKTFVDVDANNADQPETNWNADHVGLTLRVYNSVADENAKNPSFTTKVVSVTNPNQIVMEHAWPSATLQLGTAAGFPRMVVEGDVGNRGIRTTLQSFGDRVDIRNIIIHDTENGIGWWSQAEAGEYYGALTWGVGWSALDRGHGHGVYTQNQVNTPAKNIKEVISHHNFETGMKAFAVNGFVKGYNFDGVVSWENASPNGIAIGQPNYRALNLLVGADDDAPSDAINVSNSHFYFSVNNGDNNLQIGLYAYGSDTATVTGNKITRGQTPFTGKGWKNLTFTGNTIYTTGGIQSGPKLIRIEPGRSDVNNKATTYGLSTHTVNNNTYYNTGGSGKYFMWITPDKDEQGYFSSSGDFGTTPLWQTTNGSDNTTFDRNSTYKRQAPTGQEVYVRPNKYTPGRAHAIIYNWSGAATASIDLSKTGLTPGQKFEIRDSENYFADPVVSGVYGTGSGKMATATVPVLNRSMTQPLGITGLTASNEFSTFVVLPFTEDSESTPKAILTAVKRVDKTTATPGDNMVYTITLTNAGDRTATNVKLMDALPTGTGFVSASNGGTVADGKVEWGIADVPAGGTVSRTLTVVVH